MAEFASLRKLIERAPSRVTLVDVSARDGLQALPGKLGPGERARWLRRVLEAGVPEAEAGSFVRADRVPQMAGTGRVLAELSAYRHRLWVLVPNPKGLEEAAAAGARNVVCLVSATQAHSRANLGRPVERVLEDLEAMAARVAQLGLRARVAVSVAWGEPAEPAPAERVVGLCARLRGMGFQEITLADTVGNASPKAVVTLVEAVRSVMPAEDLGLHLHDASGFALAAAWAAWASGVRRFDASLAGLGGCPALEDPRGNLDLESLVLLFHACGVGTGVDPDRLAQARRANARLLQEAAIPFPPGPGRKGYPGSSQKEDG